MSKRCLFHQMGGDRKKAKLDISISDHNFPFSQNKEPAQDTWGDDNDDEILLLASQACEEAYNTNDVSLLPNYSLCMQPGSTSTQLYSTPGPSTSNLEFTFKKPTTNPPSAISTNPRQKCNRIALPLQGITADVLPNANEPDNLSNDIVFNNNIYEGQDSDYIYQKLLQVQQENAKLKSTNGKLLEKCVTKEGEASILRTQLKTCQVSVDQARLEKIKAQEKVQMEWTEKLAIANNQMYDLRTQLDFKNLEIISIKEKCKKLESTKVKLTQVTVGNNDITSSYRANSQRANNSVVQNESTTQKRVETSSNAVQTDLDTLFLALNKTYRKAGSPLFSLLPLILEPSSPSHPLLDYNEKLIHTHIPYKCRAHSAFHRVPTVNVKGEVKGNLAAIYEDLVKIATGNAGTEQYFNVFEAVRNTLSRVQHILETISQRMTSAFQKEMDEKFMESTSSFIQVSKEDLLKGRALYKEEQEVVSRRITAILSYILTSPSGVEMFTCYENRKVLFESIEKICDLLDSTSTATLYSGLLLSLTHAFPHLRLPPQQTLNIIRTMISSRSMPAVSCQVLRLLREACHFENLSKGLCPGTSVGNLKVDYDQGVLLYKKDNCHIQILLKQVEAALKCISINMESMSEAAAETTRQLLMLHYTLDLRCGSAQRLHDASRCNCQLVLVQVIVYALRICAVMLQKSRQSISESDDLVSVCRCGVQAIYQCTLKDVEFCSQLAHSEGHLMQLCDIMRGHAHTEIYANMLSELAGTLQSSPEDMPPSFHRQPWVKSFESFSMDD